ncbi:uncharacterized protein LOC144947839 [Lampetra fluviatilis]
MADGGDLVWVAFLNNGERAESPRCVRINRAADGRAVRKVLLDAFGIEDNTLILKLRTADGALLPINNHIHLFQGPLTLKVVMPHQNVEPSARSETAATLERIIATRLQGIGKRVERLERYLPHINRHRQENLRIEIECLEKQMLFLNQRMETAESLGWKGMIKRAPLW